MEISRAIHKPSADTATNWKDSGRAYLALGDFERAVQRFTDSLALIDEVEGKHQGTAAEDWIGLGRVALAQGDATEARACFERAINLARLVDQFDVQANALAWLGAAHLALGEPQTAGECTSEAVALLEGAGNSSGELSGAGGVVAALPGVGSRPG